MPEVVRGHRRTGSDQVFHHVVEDPDRAAVHVPLQVPPDLIGQVAQAGRLTVMSAVQQQPRGLHGTAGHHDLTGTDLAPPQLAGRRPADQGHPHDPTPTVDDQPLRPGLQQDLRPAGRERPRQQRVRRSRLGVGRAGEAHAHPTALARRPAAVRLGVDQQRHPQRPPTESVRRVPQQVVPGSAPHRGHRVRAAAPAGLTDRRPGHPELVIGPRVERLQVVVADRPVGQRTVVRHPVRGGHGEVPRIEAPGLCAVTREPPPAVVALLAHPCSYGRSTCVRPRAPAPADHRGHPVPTAVAHPSRSEDCGADRD